MRRAAYSIFAALLLCLAETGMPRILFVPDDYLEPQDALNESLSGDTIILRSAHYSAPLSIPFRDLTLGSEYILVQNPNYIANCVIRPDSTNAHVRCIDTQPSSGTGVQFNLVGITIQEAFSSDGDGGGIRLRDRIARISDCVFKNCAATNGGAISSDSCKLDIHRTEISGSDALNRGRCIYARASNLHVFECEFRSSSALMPTNGWQGEVELVNSPFHMAFSRLMDLGNAPEGRTTIISLGQNSVCDTVQLYGCTIADNSLAYFAYSGNALHSGMRTFVLDSCAIIDNAFAFGFLADWQIDSLRRVVVTKNWFESNHRPDPSYNGAGLFTLGEPQVSAIVEENRFFNNDGGAFSCVLASGNRDPLHYRVQRNYLSGNSNFGFSSPPGGAVYLYSLSEGILEYNAFVGNIGHAVDTGESGSDGYALHNFWGDSTGPYVAEEHPQGRGDTTDTDTIYDEWLLSEDEIPDTSLFPNPVGDAPLPISSSWQLGTIYPNPFNSEFRVVLDGMTGADFEVKLFDLLGREVALLHSGRTLRGTLSFAAPPNLAAGIYFISAHDRFYSETKKILYLK